MSETNQNGDLLFELAKLHYGRCDFNTAEEKSKEAAEAYLAEKNYDRYLDCQNVLLRIYAEREDLDNIGTTKERIQDLVLKQGLELNARTYYTLGICSRYRNQSDAALDYFQKSLAVALVTDNKEDLCYAILGLAITYMAMGRLSDALKEIYNLQVFFEVLDLPELKVSTQILNGVILRKLERYEQSLETLWACYDSLREAKNLFMYIHLLYAMGATYQEMGDIEMASVYLQLAKVSADPINLRNIYKDIEKRLTQLGIKSKKDYDLIFDVKSKSVVETRRGKVDFKNQFILLDLLHMFVKSPGQVFTKDAISKRIWGQDYNPAIHDNKIYVTIKRLRQLIEPDYDKPKYIFRAKNGYYLNKGARILVQQ